jgi:hypothetical protein
MRSLLFCREYLPAARRFMRGANIFCRTLILTRIGAFGAARMVLPRSAAHVTMSL